MNRSFVLILIALMLSAWTINAVAAERTTRDLVFEDDEAAKSDPAQKDTAASGGDTQSIGVKTTVILKRNGETSTVLPSHGFKSGDSVKLVFTPSTSGYVYWMLKGSSGKYTMLFPSAQAGTDNAVERNKEYTIPVKGAFRFDDKAGKEELLCILSAEKLPDLEKTMGADPNFVAGSEKVAEMTKNHESRRTTRDLVFEDDDQGDVNTKQQTAPKGEPFVAHYILTHE